MTQQYVYGTSSDKYKKKLFIDNGLEYQEVRARIIEPYGSPVPQPNTKELKIIKAPSHIQMMGISSYRITLVLLFEDKESYADYMNYVGFSHTFYDERGQIYIGSAESIKATPVEANRRYKLELGLILIKKDQIEDEGKPQEFQDLGDREAEMVKNINEMSQLGVINSYDRMGNPILYFFPASVTSRGQFAAYLMRTKRLIEQIIRG